MQIPDTEPNGVPWPKNQWDEVIPNLFQGGQLWEGPPDRKFSDWDAQRVKVREEFDAVFSFFHGDEPGQGPSEGVEHYRYPIPDGTLDDEELAEVRGYARVVARKVEAGDKVLVRCQAGYNRSGLVVAFALMELGYDVHEAVDLIRKARGEHALFRLVFLRYLLEAQEEKDQARGVDPA
jgi:hypothetical protein